MTQYVLRLADVPGRIAFVPPDDVGANACVKAELSKCRKKNSGYVLVTLQPPKRPRTTGKGSQNHHLNGHIMQICNETGCNYETVKNEVKKIAVENLGYPYEELNGHIYALPEHLASVEECGLLIEAAHILAAELEIVLQE